MELPQTLDRIRCALEDSARATNRALDELATFSARPSGGPPGPSYTSARRQAEVTARVAAEALRDELAALPALADELAGPIGQALTPEERAKCGAIVLDILFTLRDALERARAAGMAADDVACDEGPGPDDWLDDDGRPWCQA